MPVQSKMLRSKPMPKPKATTRVFNYIFTFHDYTPEDEERLALLEFQYLLYGHEICPDTKRPHLQGYVQMKKQTYFSTLNDYFEKRCWWYPARGGLESQEIYCKKGGDNIVELGTARSTGKFGQPGGNQPGSSTVAQRMEKNKRLFEEDLDILHRDGVIAHCQVRAVKNARNDLYEAIRRKNKPKTIDGPFKNLWFWGPPGCGKSYTARMDYPDAYLKNLNKWWCGYDGHETVLMEDFDRDTDAHLIQKMKQWADRYPFDAEVKGGSTGVIRPQRIVVTSNYHPKEIWGDNEKSLGPILRRFKVVHFDKKFNFYAQPAAALPDADDSAQQCESFYSARTQTARVFVPESPPASPPPAYHDSFNGPDDDEESVDLCTQGSSATEIYNHLPSVNFNEDLAMNPDDNREADEFEAEADRSDFEAYCKHCESIDLTREQDDVVDLSKDEDNFWDLDPSLRPFGPDDYYDDICSYLLE